MKVLCCVILLLLILNLCSAARTPHVKAAGAYRKKHIECKPLCKRNDEECIRKCISPACFAEVYRNYELEEGEIDPRENLFKECANKEFQETNVDSDKKKSNSSTFKFSIGLISLCIFSITYVIGR